MTVKNQADPCWLMFSREWDPGSITGMFVIRGFAVSDLITFVDSSGES